MVANLAHWPCAGADPGAGRCKCAGVDVGKVEVNKLTNIFIEAMSFFALIALGGFLFFGAAIWKMLGSIGEYKYEKGGSYAG